MCFCFYAPLDNFYDANFRHDKMTYKILRRNYSILKRELRFSTFLEIDSLVYVDIVIKLRYDGTIESIYNEYYKNYESGTQQIADQFQFRKYMYFINSFADITNSFMELLRRRNSYESVILYNIIARHKY